ncbi:hypothetical protein MNBD_CHLOROFLEXI01-999, partial [hydrothermal vent metagenome]
MEISLLIFWLLLLGAVVSTVLLRLRPAAVWLTAVGTTSLTLLIWLILRPQIPFEATFFRWSASRFLPDWTWRIDATAWALTAWLLLLVTAVLLHTVHTALNPNLENNKPASPAHLLLLTAATCTAIWSDSFMGLFAGLTLLLVVWLGTLWLAGEQSSPFLLKGAFLLM